MKRKTNEIADPKSGICPKCGKHKKLEWGHFDYDENNDNTEHRENGRLICHSCNMREKGVAPELTVQDRGRIARRDYMRRNYETKAELIKWEGEKTHGSFKLISVINHRTEHKSYGVKLETTGLITMEEMGV